MNCFPLLSSGLWGLYPGRNDNRSPFSQTSLNNSANVLTYGDMHRLAVWTLALAAASPAFAQETITPEPLLESQLVEEPFVYNGRIAVNSGVGSASLIGNGIVATAAHVIYDEALFQFLPISEIKYYPRYHRGATTPPGSTVFTPVATFQWTSYYDTRKENDESGPGLSTPDTFNVDYAVAYFSSGINNDIINLHAEVNVDKENEVGILRDRRTKMHVGYPSDSTYIPLSESGLMHSTAPDNYFCWWGGLEGIEERDSDGLWIAIYDFDGVTSYGGASGGPIYALDDLGNWVMSGMVVGSNGSTGMLVRGIDEGAWEWIEQAIIERGKDPLRRVTNLRVDKAGRSFVDLRWSDLSDGEAGYTVLRQSNGTWEELASLPADTTSYSDTDVLTGSVYQYRVQPYASNGNRPPKSEPVTAVTLGNSPEATGFLAQPWLQFSNTGDSNWFFDGSSKLQSGKVRSNGQSILRLDIIGPGVVDFTWSVSSEANPDYGNPDSPDKDEIWDAVFLYVDEVLVEENGKPVHLSGEAGPEARQVILDDGAHAIEWRYIKDPYADEGADAAFLHSVTWTPDPVEPYPVYGGYSFPGTFWHGSEWLGVYYTEFWPWVIHLELGWMYFTGTAEGDLYGYLNIPEAGNFYTTPAMFPYLYIAETGTWLFYYEGTGLWGSNAWFWNANTNSYFKTP